MPIWNIRKKREIVLKNKKPKPEVSVEKKKCEKSQIP
jgi:hypothetical protein